MRAGGQVFGRLDQSLAHREALQVADATEELYGQVADAGVDDGAQDLGRYGFWKDVRRVELLCATYSNVKNGIALFVTNDPSYCKREDKQVDSSVNYYDFRMTEGRKVSGKLDWKKKDSKIAKDKGYPAFKLDGEYTIHWEHLYDTKQPRTPIDFSYCMVTI